MGQMGIRGCHHCRLYPPLHSLRVSYLSTADHFNYTSLSHVLTFSSFRFLARRRRRRGLPPYYGTAWMPFRPNNPNNDPQQFQTYPPQQYNSNGQPEGYYAPPVYTPTPQMTGTHFATNSPMQTDSAYPPPIPPHPSPYYQPPAENPNQTIPHHSTGGSDYYMPPPGPPPAAHVGKY